MRSRRIGEFNSSIRKKSIPQSEKINTASKRDRRVVCILLCAGAALRAADLGEDHGMVDDDKLHRFIGQMLSDLGGAASVALVRIGDALGLYKTMHQKGPLTVGELAAQT